MGSFLASAAAFAAGDVAGTVRHAKHVLYAYIAVICLAAIGVIFALVALFFHLAATHGPVAAALVIAATSILLSLIAGFAAALIRYLHRREQRRLRSRRVLEGALLLSQMPRILRARPLLVGAVLGVGALLLLRGREDED